MARSWRTLFLSLPSSSFFSRHGEDNGRKEDGIKGKDEGGGGKLE